MRTRLLRVSLFGGLQAVAALLTIAGFGLAVAGDVSSTSRVVLGLATLVAVTVIIVTALKLRQRPLRPVSREEMVAKGEWLLEHGISHTVVLFAGDMSWAPEYGGAVAHAVNNGKSVTVLYPREKAHSTGNVVLLRDAGATVIPISSDPRLRAMLIDHEDPAQALLYVVNKRRGTKATTDIGSRPPGEEYEAKVYRWKEDALLISTATKLYQALVPSPPAGAEAFDPSSDT